MIELLKGLINKNGSRKWVGVLLWILLLLTANTTGVDAEGLLIAAGLVGLYILVQGTVDAIGVAKGVKDPDGKILDKKGKK